MAFSIPARSSTAANSTAKRTASRSRTGDLGAIADPGRGVRPFRSARPQRRLRMIGAPLDHDRLTLYGSFTSSSSYKPMLYLALAGLPFSFRTVNLKTGVQNSAGISRDQPLGRRAVIAPSRPDDSAIERDPRLPCARHRPFRGQDRAAALAGARVAVVGGRPHHRSRAGAPLGAVPQDARRGHRGVPPARRGGIVLRGQAPSGTGLS